MAEDKQHAATDKQRQKFRDQGEVPRSRDLVAFGVLLGGSGMLVLSFPSITRHLLDLTRHSFRSLAAPEDAEIGTRVLAAYLQSTAPILVGCVCLALLISYAQAGGKIEFNAIKFKLEKFNPLPKLKEMFASMNAWMEMGSSLLKVGGVGYICYLTIRQRIPNMLRAPSPDLHSALAGGTEMLGVLLTRALGVLLVLGLLDYALNRYKLEKKMRMSDQEVRDEHREDNGDPQIRAKRRSKARQMAKQRSIKMVPQADVVLVNPTHYAIAILYKAGAMSAPKVVAKGADAQAVRIRALARSSGVPVVANPPLARALYARVKLGREIPEELFAAVATVLAYVYGLRRGQVTTLTTSPRRGP